MTRTPPSEISSLDDRSFDDRSRPWARTGVLLCLAVLVALGGCLDAPTSDADEEPATGANEGAPAASDQDRGTQAEREEAPWVGAWLGEWPDEENRTLATFHADAGHRLDKVNLLASWNTSYESMEPTLDHIATSGASPVVTWFPTNLSADEIQDPSTRIQVDGNETVPLDEYIDSYAQGLCAYHERTGRTVLLEPMPEPNGDWHPWAVGYVDPDTGSSPNSADAYVNAWQHVHDRFTETCPEGAAFVWTINGVNQGPSTSYLGAFPGEEHVDHVGIRGVNLGVHQPQGWAWFGGTVGEAYCAVVEETDDLDVVLTGIGSVEEGGDKARWIEEAYRNASSHAWHRVGGIVWYHDGLHLEDGSVDVSLDSSPAAMDAYREAVDRVRNEEIPDGEPPPC